MWLLRFLLFYVVKIHTNVPFVKLAWLLFFLWNKDIYCLCLEWIPHILKYLLFAAYHSRQEGDGGPYVKESYWSENKGDSALVKQSNNCK